MKITKPKIVRSEAVLGAQLAKQIDGRRYVLLTDEVVSELCLPVIGEFVAANEPLDIIEVESGEKCKAPEICLHLWNHFIELGLNKTDVIVCLGGGSITDLGGFLSSTYKRGIACIFIPTTLLAMTDAALGGKNGINSLDVKNVIGTIVQPEAIFIYSRFCETLSRTHFLSGMAEVIKHGAISGSDLWSAFQSLPTDSKSIPTNVLKQSIAVKLSIVQLDPHEKGVRRLLNFGHTIGHAVESAVMQRGKSIEHGIAVAFGMLVEAEVAVQLKLAEANALLEFSSIIKKWYAQEWENLPLWEEISPFLVHDKKRIGEKNVCVLPLSIGNVQIVDDVPLSVIQIAYNQLLMGLF